jgi:hypothetical protein
MKSLDYDLTREFIVRHRHELRSLLLSTGRLLPEVDDTISLSHLPEANVAAIRAHCSTAEFVVVSVDLLPGFGLPAQPAKDRARILVQPVNGSNFSPSISKCQTPPQLAAEKAPAEEESLVKLAPFHPAPEKTRLRVLGIPDHIQAAKAA